MHDPRPNKVMDIVNEDAGQDNVKEKSKTKKSRLQERKSMNKD